MDNPSQEKPAYTSDKPNPTLNSVVISANYVCQGTPKEHSKPRETTTEIRHKEHRFKVVQQNFCLRPPAENTLHYINNGYTRKNKKTRTLSSLPISLLSALSHPLTENETHFALCSLSLRYKTLELNPSLYSHKDLQISSPDKKSYSY